MGDFSLRGRDMGESGIFEMVALLAFSFRPSWRALEVAYRLQFRAYSGRFLTGNIMRAEIKGGYGAGVWIAARGASAKSGPR